MAISMDGSARRLCRNHSKRVARRKICGSYEGVILSLFGAGAGNLGGGECCQTWDWRVSGCGLERLNSRNCLAGLLDALAPMGLPASFTFGGSLVRSACFGDSRAFWRKPRTKRSFCRLDVCWRQSRVKQAPWLYVVCGAKSACVVAPPTLDVTCMAVLCSLWHTVWPNCRCGTHLRAASVAGGKCVCVIPRIWSKKARWCKFSGDGWRC